MNKVLNQKLLWKTEFLRALQAIHKFSAYGVLIWAQQLIFTGMRDFQKISNLADSYLTWYYSHLGVLSILMIICESLWRDWSVRNGRVVPKKQLPFFSSAAYDRALRQGR